MNAEPSPPAPEVDQGELDSNSVYQAKQRLYKILLQRPEDQESRQLLRQICRKYQASFLQNKPRFLAAFEREYQAIYQQVIPWAALGWRYCLGLDQAFIDPTLQPLPQPKHRENQPAVTLLPAPCTASQYLEHILNIDDLHARWLYVNELVYAPNEQLLADDFGDKSDHERSEMLPQALGGSKLNILVLGAGCVGLAFANVLKTALGDLVNILIIENRIQAKHIKKPYTRNWLTNLPNTTYENFFDPRVVQILREFGNGDYMGVPLNVLETLLFLSNRARGVKFYFDDNYQLSLINGTDTDLVVDATGGNLKLVEGHEWNENSLTVNLTACRQFGAKYQTFGITNLEDMPVLRLTLEQKGAFFYPSFAGKQLKTAMFKLTDVPLELYANLLATVSANNRDGLIYVWPGKLRPELNSLLILVNLSPGDYQHLGSRLSQKTNLHLFVNQYAQDLPLDERILTLFEQILAQDVERHSNIEPPFLYQPHLYVAGETRPQIFGRPIFRLGDSVFNGHPKVGNGLGSHLHIVCNLHDALLAQS